MSDLYLKRTKVLPEIFFNRGSGKLEIKGQSCPPNPDSFYEPVLKWIDNYMEYPCEETTIEFYLSYFNTISAKIILLILNKMQKLSESGNTVLVRWMYDKNDDDLEEAGLDFEMIVNVPFEMVEVN